MKMLLSYVNKRRSKPYNRHSGLGLRKPLLINVQKFTEYIINILRKTNTANLKLENAKMDYHTILCNEANVPTPQL